MSSAASLRIRPPLLWSAAVVLPVLCTAVVGARLLVRKTQKFGYGLDDWLVLPALVLVWGMAVTIMIGTAQQSLGYPTPKAPPGQALTTASPQQVVAEKSYLAITLLQTASLTFTKLSIMMFYRRIFRPGNHKTITIVIGITNTLIIIWGVSFFFSFLFTCHTDFKNLWSSTADALQCEVDPTKEDLAISISDVIMDVFILCFPIPLIAKLQMSTGRKVAVLGVFLLGASSIALSITRMAIVVGQLSVYVQATADEDFVSTDALYFMFLEGCIGLIAVCLPSISGILKVKGIRTMIDAIASNFSLSSGSRRSQPRATNSTPGETIAQPKLHTQSSSTSRADLRGTSTDQDIELDRMPDPGNIKVSHTVEQSYEYV